MARYVISVPNPAAGADWSYTIPGQWLLRIASVTAHLTTGSVNRTVALQVANGTAVVGKYSSGFPATGTPGSAGALISADSFNRANNAGSLGSTNGAGSSDPQAWTQQVGTNGIISNMAYAPVAAATATLNLGTGDVDLSLTHVAADNNGFGIFLRYVDVNNYVNMLGDNTQCTLAKRVAGVPIGILASFGALGAGTVMRVASVGPVLTVWLDGVQKGSASDNFQQGVTLAGMRMQGSSQRADNWIARVPGGATAYDWTWVTGLNASSQSANGSAVTVGIPPLTLPAGYVIGTSTPDLAAGDQWSNITIWADNLTDGAGGGPGTSTYWNRLLTPDYQGRSH